MIHLHSATFDEPLGASRWRRYMALLPEDLRLRVARFARWQDAHALLIGRVLLRRGLIEMGCSSDCLELVASDRYGRPYLEGGPDFNISHSGGMVLCAVSAEGRVGIDLERIRPLSPEDFRDYMTTDQWDWIASGGGGEEAEGLRRFYFLWTMKESVLKADGRGLSGPIAEVGLDGEGKAELDGRVWYLRELDVGSGFVCHLASNRPL